jgi:hypothetical protein
MIIDVPICIPRLNDLYFRKIESMYYTERYYDLTTETTLSLGITCMGMELVKKHRTFWGFLVYCFGLTC